MAAAVPAWAQQLSALMEEGEGGEDFEDAYIWFGAEASDSPVTLEGGREASESARRAAVRGSRREREHLELSVELSQRWAEVAIRRLERERDDALDAVELVSGQLIEAAGDVGEKDLAIDGLRAEVAALRAQLSANKDKALIRAECDTPQHLAKQLSDTDVAAEFFRRQPAAFAFLAAPPRRDENGRWQVATRLGWPPRKSVTPSKADDVPGWVRKIAPFYTKEDFEALRARCHQFEAELARAAIRDCHAPRLKPVASSSSVQ